MRKVIVLFIALVLCFSVLAGCGGGSSVYGKYTVSGVLNDGKILNDYEEIANIYGYSIYEWKKATLTLTKSGIPS